MDVRRAVLRRHFDPDEPPTFFLCNVCERDLTRRPARVPDTVVLRHYPSISRFTAYTVRPMTDDDRAAHGRAMALLVMATTLRHEWPDA